MDRSRYLALRNSVESEILAVLPEDSTAVNLVNAVMRRFVEADSRSEVDRQQSRRQLLTFRRQPDVKTPSWAYRKPGIVPVTPTLRN